MSVELVAPVTHASNRLADSLDPPALILLLVCFALGFTVWQMWKRVIDVTDKFIQMAEKTNITQERLCNHIEGKRNG